MDKRQTNINHQSQKQTLKRHPGTENWAQEGRKWHPKRPKIVPRRAEEGAKTIPNRKSNQEAHQDNPKTVQGAPQGRFAPLSLTSRGPFGRPKTTQNGTENDPKSKRKSRIEKKRSKTIKDPSWSDLGPFGGAMWEPEDPKSVGKRIISCKFTFSKIRWFEDGSGTNLGRPRRQKERK